MRLLHHGGATNSKNKAVICTTRNRQMSQQFHFQLWFIESEMRCKPILTYLQNLMELPGLTGRAGLAVDAFGVEAVQLHVHQQQLHHFGHGVGFAGQETHVHPKVQGAGHVVILPQRMS